MAGSALNHGGDHAAADQRSQGARLSLCDADGVHEAGRAEAERDGEAAGGGDEAGERCGFGALGGWAQIVGRMQQAGCYSPGLVLFSVRSPPGDQADLVVVSVVFTMLRNLAAQFARWHCLGVHYNVHCARIQSMHNTIKIAG